MTEAESIVLEFLKANPACAFARKEIARKAIRRSDYEKNPHWADAPLHALVHKKLVELNEEGHYQFKADD